MRHPENYIAGLGGTNDKYNEPDRNVGGSYRTSDKQFPNPSEVKFFAGFGANEEDLARGWCEPVVHELPQYDKVNYEQRLTQERVVDEDVDDGLGSSFQKDMEFRKKDLVTKGLFARPRIPNER